MRMQQHNLNFTKLPNPLPPPLDPDLNPIQEPGNATTNNIFYIIVPTSSVHKSYSDQTGRSTLQSSWGYQYMFILYYYETNIILSKLLRTRQSLDITTAWKEMYVQLCNNGLPPDLHIIDNECSSTIQAAFGK